MPLSFSPVKDACMASLVLICFVSYLHFFPPPPKTNPVYPASPSASYFMGAQKWERAIDAYEKGLSINPGFEQAIFNKGLALKNTGRNQASVQAWKEYLAIKQTGLWALRAVAHLNAAGDFTYRTHLIGKQRIIMRPFLNNLHDKLPLLGMRHTNQHRNKKGWGNDISTDDEISDTEIAEATTRDFKSGFSRGHGASVDNQGKGKSAGKSKSNSGKSNSSESN